MVTCQGRNAGVQATVAAGVARGMAHLHGQDPPVIHRDLKPDNVLLAEGLVPKVADFGVSREGDASLTMTHVGTPLFSSPEVLTRGRYDASVDVWSFGCVLCCLSTQCHPYHPYTDPDDAVERVAHKQVMTGEKVIRQLIGGKEA